MLCEFFLGRNDNQEWKKLKPAFSNSQLPEFIQEEHLHRHAAAGLSQVFCWALYSDREVECLEGGFRAWVSHMAGKVPRGAAW